MPRICTHPQRDEIDRALVSGQALRTIADHYPVSKTSLIRHKQSHIPQTLTESVKVEEIARADSLLEEVCDLQAKALDILEQAEVNGDFHTAVYAIREARGSLELLAKLVGKLDKRPTVNVLIAPEWLFLRTTFI